MPRQIWILAAIGQMALIWWLSSRPAGDFPEIVFPHADKVVHLGLFGALAMFWVLGLPGRRGLILAFCITVVWGAIDEWHQTFVDGRSGDLADWMFDSLGALIAVSAGGYLRESD